MSIHTQSRVFNPCGRKVLVLLFFTLQAFFSVVAIPGSLAAHLKLENNHVATNEEQANLALTSLRKILVRSMDGSLAEIVVVESIDEGIPESAKHDANQKTTHTSAPEDGADIKRNLTGKKILRSELKSLTLTELTRILAEVELSTFDGSEI